MPAAGGWDRVLILASGFPSPLQGVPPADGLLPDDSRWGVFITTAKGSLAWRPGTGYCFSHMRSVEADTPVPAVDGSPPDDCLRYSGMEYPFSLKAWSSCFRLNIVITVGMAISCHRLVTGIKFSLSPGHSHRRRHGDQLVPIRRWREMVFLS